MAHKGVRIAAAWAETHLKAPSEHRLLNMGWSQATGVMLGRSAHGVGAGLRLADLCLVLATDGELQRGHPLSGESPQALLHWMQEQAAELGARDATLTLPSYRTPPELVLSESLPVVSPDASTRVGAHFARAMAILRDLATAHEGASEVRLWIRDFDVTLTVPGQGEHPIECAYAPSPLGGRHWAVYVHESVEPPTLSDGEWMTGERTGAILHESSLPDFGGERAIRDWLGGLLAVLGQP